MTEKGIVKKHIDHLHKKRNPIKDKIYLEVQLEKRDLNRNETTVIFPVTANNTLQSISDPTSQKGMSSQKQLRTQINNVAQLAHDNLIESQSEETNPGSSGGGSDTNIVLRRSQRERRPPKYLEDYDT